MEYNIRQKIAKILAQINEGIFEREEVLGLSLLSAMAGESIFLLGLPGVGKSMVARRLKLAFEDARTFEYLMSRFSTPEEIFGPVSITKLKDADTYERVTKGYLPEAEVVFLDEIWKAGPAIQNSLLTAINEKIYHNGDHDMNLPIKAIIAASNELPAEGEGLEALWDRFLIRFVVNPIILKDNFMKLIGVEKKQKKQIHDLFYNQCAFSNKEYNEILENSAEVEIPQSVINVMYDLRLNQKTPQIDKLDIYISDRRWKKVANVMRTSAYLNGRDIVDLSDVLLMSHMLWDNDSQIAHVNKVIAQCLVKQIFADVVVKRLPTRNNLISSAKRERYRIVNGCYVLNCGGYIFYISKDDYATMRESPRKYFLAGETSGSQLVFSEKGQYELRAHQEGYLLINSCNYELTVSGRNDVPDVVEEFKVDFDSATKPFEQCVDDNVFTRMASIRTVIQSEIIRYKHNFMQMR